MSNPSLYAEHGCRNRREYLVELANEHGVDVQTVFALAQILGPEEDFDGLVTSIEDLAFEGGAL